MRTTRFDPSVPSVNQNEFYESNFLKHYRKTSKNPDYLTIIDGLKILDGISGDFRQLIGALIEHQSEYDVIQIYSSNILVGTKRFYIYINEQLYKDDDHTLSKLMPLIRRATFQINDKTPSCSCLVYRAMDLSSSMKQSFQIGEVFRFPGFVSTSRSKDKAKQFGNTLFAIHIDSHCLHVRDISDISCYPHEEEWLFSPYSLFEVIDQDDEAIILTSHDNMQDIGMNSKVIMTDENQMTEASSVHEEDNMDDISATTAITTTHEEQIEWKSSSKKKVHKKSCCIQ